MASGADVLATNLVWAAGYNTPENHVYTLDPDRLALAEGLDTEAVLGSDDPERELTIDLLIASTSKDTPARPTARSGRSRAGSCQES